MLQSLETLLRFATTFRWMTRLRSVACLFAFTALPAPACAEGIIVFGTIQEGDGVNAFERVIDFSSGHERTTETQGLAATQFGFDGRYWSFVNGAVGETDMPSAVADRRAETWIRQSAWRTSATRGEVRRRVSLAQTSRIDLMFDPRTRRVATAKFDGDYGPVTFTFGNWQRSGTHVYPGRLERSSTLGGYRVELARSVRILSRVDPNLLIRPVSNRDPGKLGSAVTIPVKFVGKNRTHTSVTAQINGTPAEFIFDTGAANILTIDAAKRLQIRAFGGINIGGVGEGTDAGGFGFVNRVSLGAAGLDDQSFMVIPSPFPPVNGKPSETAGLLGFEFLAHYVTTIDYDAETITFRKEVPPGQPGIRLPFVADGHAIAITARVNGEPVLLRLDTGDGGTVTFFPAYTRAAGLDRGAGAVKVVGSGGGGDVRASSGSIDRLTLGDVDFDNLPVQFSKNSAGAFASRRLAGNLGAGVLRCFRITFDYPNHQLWLEPQLDQPQCAATRR